MVKRGRIILLCSLGLNKKRLRFTGAMRQVFRRVPIALEGFAPKGEAPVIRMVAEKSHVSVISAITNGGKVRFMMVGGSYEF